METTPSFRVSLHSIHSATTDESPENIIHCVQTCAHVCHLQRDPPFPAGEERNRRKQQQLVGIVPVYCALATASAAETETISFHFLGGVWNSAQHSHFRPTSGQEHCALFSTIGFSLVRRPPAPSRYLAYIPSADKYPVESRAAVFFCTVCVVIPCLCRAAAAPDRTSPSSTSTSLDTHSLVLLGLARGRITTAAAAPFLAVCVRTKIFLNIK